MEVYFYYDKIGNASYEHRAWVWEKLLDLAMDSWRRAGWRPVVLNESHAQKCSYFEQLVEKSQKVPCVNHRNYQRCNFVRWAAVYAMGGGLHVDIDVLNFGFLYGHLRNLMKTGAPAIVFTDSEGGLGGAAWIPKDMLPKFFDQIIAYEGPWESHKGRPHWSIDHCLYKFGKQFGWTFVSEQDIFYKEYFQQPNWPKLGHFAYRVGELDRLELARQAFEWFWHENCSDIIVDSHQPGTKSAVK